MQATFAPQNGLDHGHFPPIPLQCHPCACNVPVMCLWRLSLFCVLGTNSLASRPSPWRARGLYNTVLWALAVSISRKTNPKGKAGSRIQLHGDEIDKFDGARQIRHQDTVRRDVRDAGQRSGSGDGPPARQKHLLIPPVRHGQTGNVAAKIETETVGIRRILSGPSPTDKYRRLSSLRRRLMTSSKTPEGSRRKSGGNKAISARQQSNKT